MTSTTTSSNSNATTINMQGSTCAMSNRITFAHCPRPIRIPTPEKLTACDASRKLCHTPPPNKMTGFVEYDEEEDDNEEDDDYSETEDYEDEEEDGEIDSLNTRRKLQERFQRVPTEEDDELDLEI